MKVDTYEEYGYLLENMKPIEAISHLIHSRVFELLGYISIARREENSEDIDIYISRLEEISEKLISEFHTYLAYYHISENSEKIEK